MEEPKKMPRGKPFTAGDDSRRNVKGRHIKGKTLAEKVRQALEESNSESNPEYTKLDAILDKLIARAKTGYIPAIEYLLARGWGKLIDRIEANNVNKNYDFSNLSLEDRMKFLELLEKTNGTTVHTDSPDSL